MNKHSKSALLTSLTLAAGITVWLIFSNQHASTPLQSRSPEVQSEPGFDVTDSPSVLLPPATPAHIQIIKNEDGTVLTIFTDPQLVYQKAFWRRLSTTDKVIHAQRLEWADSSGNIIRWQWFIEVEPGSETHDWLATNPFSLSPASIDTGKVPVQQPDWFPTDFRLHRVLQSSDRRHTLIFTSDSTRIYATDSGFGFRPSS